MIIEQFTTAKTRKPELVALREELAAAERALKERDRERAADRRELEHTVKTCANQIQLLALRHSEVEEENRKLRRRIEDQEAVTRIR